MQIFCLSKSLPQLPLQIEDAMRPESQDVCFNSTLNILIPTECIGSAKVPLHIIILCWNSLKKYLDSNHPCYNGLTCYCNTKYYYFFSYKMLPRPRAIKK